MTFSSPSWRSLSHLKGSLVTKNHLVAFPACLNQPTDPGLLVELPGWQVETKTRISQSPQPERLLQADAGSYQHEVWEHGHGMCVFFGKGNV